MFEGWLIIAVALGYVSALFALAWIGDRFMRSRKGAGGRPLIYALSIAVYCTSWTFFGSVGSASATGFDFIPVYLGPIIMFTIGWPLVLRIVRLAKSQNITSVADFLAARYGKSPAVAAVVTLVVVVGVLPYIALQLKAIAVSIETLLGGSPLVSIEAAARRLHGHRIRHHADARHVRGAVRNPAHRRHRAPGRVDAGDCDRVAGQVDRVHRSRAASPFSTSSTVSPISSRKRSRARWSKACSAALSTADGG